MCLGTVLENKDVEWNNSAAVNILLTSYATFVEALPNIRKILYINYQLYALTIIYS